MDKSNRFSLMMDALTELVQEEVAPPITPKPALPTLASVLADNSPLPSEALYLGQAEDGLPVLLNLHDPVPGPILISADRLGGKTLLLQTIARAADLLHPPSRVQYGIITPRPEEWQAHYGGQSNAGIFSTHEDNSRELLQSLVTWAHNNKGSDQSVLLMLDDLDAALKLGEQAQQNLRWLLLRGTSRRVWTFVTLNASRANSLTDWLGFFRTRLFGSVQHPDEAALLTGSRTHMLDHLTPGAEFAMREGNNLLTFWLPSLE